ncbi:MAG: aminotransferase class I/II-fold pyridoxal phosphate-dependent enzyme [Candidatus Gastranaerophilales bacterium]|nr:aminotransferase class I/II-fold pyridoxal phosphate-dependent enzyme [Candidatus Gastranaerophilales bacterium]
MIKPKKSIANIESYPVFDGQEEWLLKLDFNENLIGPSKRVLNAIKNIDIKNIKFYPKYRELIKELALYNHIDESYILPTNGADEALKYVFDAFVESGDEVLTVTPSFSMPKTYGATSGCEYKEINYVKKWEFPLNDFLDAINEKTKLIIITSPNSPTGELICDESLKKIIAKAQHSIILIDETYATYADVTYVDLAKRYNNVIVIKSMSKDFALAGLRLGYIIADESLVKTIRKIISPFSVNSIACLAGVSALKDLKHLEYIKKEVDKSKKYLTEALASFAKVIYPSFSNFLCIDFGERAKFIYKKLLKQKIKTKLFEKGELKNHFRLTICDIKGAKKLVNALQSREMIVFDMDGVLVDTSQSYRMAVKKTYEFFANKEISFDKISEAKNKGGLNNDWDLTEFLLKEKGLDISKSEIIEKFQELYLGEDYDGLISNEKWLISKEKLEDLAKEYDLAIFTGRPKEEALYAVKKAGVENLFEPVITMDDLPKDKQKPHCSGLEKIKTTALPTALYYLGDTPDDMICAVSANAFPMGVLPPQDKSVELETLLKNNGAMVVLKNTEELIDFLEQR